MEAVCLISWQAMTDPKTGKPIDVDGDNVIEPRDMTLLDQRRGQARRH